MSVLMAVGVKYSKNVSDCILWFAGGIADPKVFARQPEVYAYGMVVALGVGTLWLLYTSWKGLNVSSTHTISAPSSPFAHLF